ncbi:MAG: GLPGLI family protein, partial [Bacteroidota bacterium]
GKHIHEDIRVDKDENNIFFLTKSTNKPGFLYYNDLNNSVFLNRDIGFNYVKEKTETIAWKIHKETKNIGNVKCFKASGDFRGRLYTVWFTTEIPLPFGPWKLQGLPGLILEAYDTNKEVYYYFNSIEYPVTNKTILIQKPNPSLENKKWQTLEDYKKYITNSFNKSIANGRMLFQQTGVLSEENEMTMKDVFVEIFE